MAEQFLQRPQIGAAPEQMGGEAVAQRVRRGPLGQAERTPRACWTARRMISPRSGPPRAPRNSGASLPVG